MSKRKKQLLDVRILSALSFFQFLTSGCSAVSSPWKTRIRQGIKFEIRETWKSQGIYSDQGMFSLLHCRYYAKLFPWRVEKFSLENMEK